MFITTLAQTLGPEAALQYVNPEEYVKRLAASQGIDTLNLVKGMEEVMAEQQRTMQQEQQMELTKQAGSFASTEQKAIESQNDRQAATAQEGLARSRHLSLSSFRTLVLLQRLTSMHLKKRSELPPSVVKKVL